MPKVGALAICKAHPLVFGAFVAIAIGVVVYTIVKSKKQKSKKHAYSNSSNRPNGGDDGDGPTDFFFYDSTTKSITNSAAPVKSNASENNLRRRPAAQNSSSIGNEGNSEVADEKKNKSTVSKEVQTESVDYNQNDINKVLPAKDLSVAMSVDERINDYLRNIPAHDSSENNDELDSEGSITKPIRNCCCNCDSHSAENSCSSSASSDCSSWSDISLSDVDSIKNRKKSRKSRTPSVCSIETETSVGTVLSGDSKLCKGCEERPVNTHAQPCNHRYMCSDCAMRIFKLYKRCKVCRARIERIVVED